ncbi:Cupredoxin [Lentinula raphanica]|nr:Cupredoxin [Lentinula raphanica]
MRFFAVVAALVSAVAAETFTVIVGGNSSIAYSPTSVNATTGDVIQFQFVSKNHTVTQSTFAAPCTAMAGGVDSGFQAVATNATTFPVWSFTLTNTSAPLWFFCAQTGHCAKDGMVFAVNPTASKSFEAFQAAALATGSNSTTTNSTTGTPSSATTSASSGSGASSVSASAAVASQSTVGAAAANGASPLALNAMVGLVTVFCVGVGLGL